jgi:rhodanese-related sulfurtransferase
MINDITPRRAKELLDAGGWQYLDVRTAGEFESGALPGAVNVPLFRPNLATGEMEPNLEVLSGVQARFAPDTGLIVGCAAGKRAAIACEILHRAGYVNLRYLAGPLDELRSL